MSTQMHTQTKATPQTAFTPAPTGLLQRKCACGQHTVAGGECEACRAKREGMLQRTAVNAAPIASNGVPPIVHEVLSSTGQPLDVGTRAFMELRFGHDFSKVRVHADIQAAESARAVNALAYTVGRNMVFGTGQYTPETGRGKRLLAHELTHVVQQASHSHLAMSQGISSHGDPYEREAESVASKVSSEQNTRVALTTSSPLLQRQDENLRLSEPTLLPPRREPSLFRPGEHPHLNRPTLGYITEIHVDLNRPQDVFLTWSDGTFTAGIECSTGQGHCCPRPCDPPRNRLRGSNCTPDGTFTVIDKSLRTGHGLNFFVHFTPGREVGLHEYEPVDGTPLSHGCVRLHRSDARLIYNGSVENRTRVRVTGVAVPTCPRTDTPLCRGTSRTRASITPESPTLENEMAQYLEQDDTSISELDSPMA